MATKDFNPKELQHNYFENDDDSEEETLSFSNLPLNNNFSSSTEHKTSSYEHDNLFEFFSEDFTNDYPSIDIIFCGKLIPARNHLNLKSNSFSAEQVDEHEKRFKSSRSFPVIHGDHQSKRERIEVLRKKSRWNSLFGSFPTEMKMRDIKRRQNKKKPVTIFRSSDYDKNELMVKSIRTEKLNGFWGLLRVFAFI
ncbi:hypothetical protein M5689_001674 [Euphorbia peplus]|nr:hypothetical protein M5689_001674 [Euphorbia peplus]